MYNVYVSAMANCLKVFPLIISIVIFIFACFRFLFFARPLISFFFRGIFVLFIHLFMCLGVCVSVSFYSFYALLSLTLCFFEWYIADLFFSTWCNFVNFFDEIPVLWTSLVKKRKKIIFQANTPHFGKGIKFSVDVGTLIPMPLEYLVESIFFSHGKKLWFDLSSEMKTKVSLMKNENQDLNTHIV